MPRGENRILHLSALFFRTEAKGQRRVPLPARLGRCGEPPRRVLLCERGRAAQTGGSRAAPGAARTPPRGAEGEGPGSLGEETEEERRGEPLRPVENALAPLRRCQRSKGRRVSGAARAGPGRCRVQRDHHLLRRPAEGLTTQRARQSCQD